MSDEVDALMVERGDAEEKQGVPLPVELSIDPGVNRLRGWAAPSLAQRADDPLIISVMLGSVCLGTVRRHVSRPDVDQYLRYLGPPVGFDIDDFGLQLFAWISRIDDVTLSTAGRSVEPVKHPIPRSRIEAMNLAPLGLHRKSVAGMRLIDIWFESHRNLSLRFEGEEQASGTIDFYQVAYCSTQSLVKIEADLPLNGGATIVTARLLNPFAPLLLVMKDSSGGIRAIDTLPFPSLTRGGWHAAERLIAGYGGDELADTAALSTMYLTKLEARMGDPTDHVGRIMIDGAAHTGLEPALNECIITWLRNFLGIEVMREGEAAEYLPHLDESLSQHSADDPKSVHILHLPADAIPTIAAVVNAIPSGLLEQTVTGSMGVVEWHRHGRIWSVSFPALNTSLTPLQPRGVQQPFPRLQVGSRELARIDYELVLSWPLALLLCDKPVRIGNESPFEVADIQSPLFETDVLTATEELSVTILFDNSDVSPLPFLQSLVRQEIGSMDITLCRPADADDSELREVLHSLFPEQRHRIVLLPSGTSQIEQIIAVRDGFACEEVLIVNASTILQDDRTLNALMTLLRHPDVATAGCLVREISEDRNPISAGYSLVGLDLRATPSLSFDAIDPAALRQPATFPVLANSLAALVTRRVTLSRLEHHGGNALRPEIDDLLLGLKALDTGGINLCTTAVSVYSHIPPPRHSQAAITLPYRLSLQTLGRIADKTTVVQKIR